MPSETKCSQCGKIINEDRDFFKIRTIIQKDNIVSEKDFCSLDCANRYDLAHKAELPLKEGLEQEIKLAVEEKKEVIETSQKIAEQQKVVNAIGPATATYEKKEMPKETAYLPKGTYAQEKTSEKTLEEDYKDYLQNQEFYIKNPLDFDKLNSIMQQIKSQESGMSRVDDSDLWIIEPETKKLKIRRMPRTVLDKLKEKNILFETCKTP